MGNYIEKAHHRLAELTGCTGTLLDLYTLLVFVKGKDCTLKDVHDAWSIWKNEIDGTHRSLIPFDELSVEVQELDREYADAIIQVAEELS